jgi:hypothetical protein
LVAQTTKGSGKKGGRTCCLWDAIITRACNRLLAELKFEVRLGDPAQIRAKQVRRQKNDRRDAEHILKLMLEDNFLRVWVPTAENRDPTGTGMAPAPPGQHRPSHYPRHAAPRRQHHQDRRSCPAEGRERSQQLSPAARAVSRSSPEGQTLCCGALSILTVAWAVRQP